MSVYDNIKRKFNEEKAYYSASVIDDQSKMVSVRPDPMTAALIEIFSYFENKAPAEFISTHFAREIAEYLMGHKETIESIKKVLNNGEVETVIPSEKNALGILNKEGVLKIHSANFKFD